MPDDRRERSETETFGTPTREGHDASGFYGSGVYEGVRRPDWSGEYSENCVDIPGGMLDRVTVGDARDMSELPDRSVHLAVTSPPYNVGKEYDEGLDLVEYLELLRSVFGEVLRVLVPGGRAAINIANVGRKPYLPLHAKLIEVMEELGYFMRGEIIWDKGASAGTSCAWGSFASASNPCLRDVHEYILVFSKDTNRLEPRGRGSTISERQFTEWTKSVWRFQAASARRVGHPAPFPAELPKRCTELYTFAGDVVLDPFAGSGTTGVAALRAGRRFVGYEIRREYAELAECRLRDIRGQKRVDEFISPGPKVDDFFG
jgi:site-specific DNA-methyltransferase (adenine-specific)